MTKSSKSTATIRRRKTKPTAEFLSKVRKNQPHRAELAISQEETEEEIFFYKEVLRSSAIEKIMSSDKTLFLGLLVIRLVNAMLIQTWFVPDEFWQSVEVAHKMIFDYGYITWEWKVGIRSYAYPLIFGTFYKVLEVLGLDNRQLMIRGPRLVQGVMASMGDLYLFFLSRRLAGKDVAKWTLLCQLLSWFSGYCCTRTLSNSMETVLITAALFYFPWPQYFQPKGYSRRFVVLAALSVVVRPTAALIWILLCSWHLQKTKGAALLSVLQLYITSGLAVLGISTVIDRIWYGEWLLVHLKFLQFNVLSGGSGFYGRHPWHWYLTQGLPVTLGTHTFPFMLGAWQAGNKVLLLLLVWKVFVLSFLAHKEFRFLLPILPLAMHYCGIYFHSASKPAPQAAKKKGNSKDQPDRSPGKEKSLSEEAGSLKAASKDDETAMSTVGKFMDTFDCNGMEKKALAESSGKECTSSKLDHDPADQEKCDRMDEKSKTASEQGGTELRDKPNPNTGASSLKCEDGSPLQSSEDKKKEGEEEKEEKTPHKRGACKVRVLVLLLAVSNLLPLLYFSLIHQRGTIDVMNYLNEAAIGIRNNSNKSHQQAASPDVDILFLMPCHSTPYYSFLHVNVSMRFLTCEPNLGHMANYTDEADVFYQDPGKWLREAYQTADEADHPKLPTHVVYFNVLLGSIGGFLRQKGFLPCAKFFHTHVPEGRVGSHVLVSCR